MDPFFAESQPPWSGDHLMTRTSRVYQVSKTTWKQQDRKALNNKILVHNFPVKLSPEEVREFLRINCPWIITVLACERANNKSPHKVSYIVELSSIEEAQLVLDNVHGKQYHKATLKVVPFAENHAHQARAQALAQTHGSIYNQLSQLSSKNAGPVYPFRFLVPTFLIGAIIGVNGSTVKKFQVQSGARYIIVDAQDEDERFPDEKPVTIFGSAESQIKALKSILAYLDSILTVRRRETSFETDVTETPDSGCPSECIGSDNGHSLAVDSSELSEKLISSSNDHPHAIATNLDLNNAETENDSEICDEMSQVEMSRGAAATPNEDLTPRQIGATSKNHHISCSKSDHDQLDDTFHDHMNDTFREMNHTLSAPASPTANPIADSAASTSIDFDDSDWDQDSSRGSSPQLTILCSSASPAFSDMLDTSEGTTLSSGLISPVVARRNPELSQDENEYLLGKFVPPLAVKLLTHDHLVGRLIGKRGCNLANIKRETNTKIAIPVGASSRGSRLTNMTYSDPGHQERHLERLICIEGTRDNTVKAATLMLTKLRNAYERDVEHIVKTKESMQSLYPNTAWPSMGGTPGAPFLGAATMGGITPQILASSAGAASADPFAMSRLGAALPMPNFGHAVPPSAPPGALPSGYQNPFLTSTLGAPPPNVGAPPQLTPIPMPSFAASPYEQFQHQPESCVPETTYMYIHHGAVGAIIGNRGTNIHMIKQLSQAQVTVDTQSDHQSAQRKIRNIIHRGKLTPSSGANCGPPAPPINFIPTFSEQHLPYGTSNPPPGPSGASPQVVNGKSVNASSGNGNVTSSGSAGHMFFAAGTSGNSAAPIATSAQLAAAASLSNIVGANQNTPASAAINSAINNINSLGKF